MQSSNYYQPNPQQQYMLQPSMVDDNSISHAPPGSGGAEDDDSDGSGMPDKRSGRRKIKIEYINDKSRRHITFSKRKAGIMKKVSMRVQTIETLLTAASRLMNWVHWQVLRSCCWLYLKLASFTHLRHLNSSLLSQSLKERTWFNLA